MLDLLTLVWVLNTAQPVLSSLTAEAPQAEFAIPKHGSNGFTVTFTVDLKPFQEDRTILEISNVLEVRLRHHDPLDRQRQNYPAFRMPDGSVPVLEATVALHSAEHPDWKDMTIGIPLALLQRPEGEHNVVLNFSGVRWTLYVDGELLDNDFPFGYPRWADRAAWKLDSHYVKKAAAYLPAVPPRAQPAKRLPRSPGIQYWLPREHNNWVGDVATLFHRGRYHVFYLYDRRHHQSKFGCGAHYFEHLSTTDFKTWTEHEAATPLEEQWECIGTGVPFVFRNQLCLSYGLHTTRVVPQEQTSLPAQWEYLKQNGRTGSFQRSNSFGLPAGSTYAVSVDGISNFRKSHVMFHPCENPSVYVHPDGGLRMMANYRSKGIWESDRVDGGWGCIHPDFPPGGDCTFFFRWGTFDYVIGGFTGFWSKPAHAPDSAYEDVVSKGLDFYDGLNVPSVTAIRGGRYLMAGWIPIRGWGGNLVIRELLQYANGRIGSKWMKEILPATGTPGMLAARISDAATFQVDSGSFLLSFEAKPSKAKQGSMAIAFLPESHESNACQLQIQLDERRAQFSPATASSIAVREKSLREGGAPHAVGNYAIENLIGVDGPFTVRVLVKGCDKIGGSLVDAEIAGQRTMITYRQELAVRKLVFQTKGIDIRKPRIAPLLN